MKKILTKLLITSILCAIISSALCFFSIPSSNSKTSRTNQKLNEILSEDDIDDVEGYSYILEISGSILADVAEGLVYAFILLIPSAILFIIIISQVISRLVQIGDEKNWKNTLSKVFTYISVVLQGILCITLVLYMLSSLNLNRVLLFLNLILNIGCIVFFIKELAKIKKVSIEGSYEK